MGFLHKLWDETLAGPAPDFGLGKLRKYDSFASSSSSSSIVVPHEEMAVSRSITILRTNNLRNLSVDSPGFPSSPCTPMSPATPQGEFKGFARRKSAVENQGLERAEPRNPTVYDWVVISALDR